MKYFIAILLFFVQVNCLFSQVVSMEGFEGGTFPPTNWSLKPAINPGIWIQVNNGTLPTTAPHTGSSFARFRSGSTQVSNGAKQSLVSRQVDYSNRGTNSANLKFWMYRDNISPSWDSISVFVSNVDSLDTTAVHLGTIARNRTYSLPDTQSTSGWYQYSFSIPLNFTNNTTTRFFFQGSCEKLGGTQMANMFIDDIEFDEFPTQCTGTPNVGNIVKSTSLICGGSGTAQLSLSTPLAITNGIVYSWEEASSLSGPWVVFGTNIPTVTTNSLSSNAYFRCIVQCSFSSLTYTTPVDSILVSVNPPPVVVLSPQTATYCPGAAAIPISASGAASYVWGPATGLDTTQGSIVNAQPASNTQYTVTAVDSLGCTSTVTINVTLGTLPNVNITATPSDTVCSGSTIILNSIPSGTTQGNIYLWSTGQTTRRDTVVINATTTFSVTVTNAIGCSLSDSIVITALPPQVSGFKYTYTGNTYTFTDTSVGSTNWSWDFGDLNGSSTQNPVYTYSAPGNYDVTLIVTGPCETDTITIPIIVYPLSSSTIDPETIALLYPNPAKEKLMISNAIGIQAISVFNLLGETVVPISHYSSLSEIKLDVSSLPSGVYILNATSADGLIHKVFCKE